MKKIKQIKGAVYIYSPFLNVSNVLVRSLIRFNRKFLLFPQSTVGKGYSSLGCCEKLLFIKIYSPCNKAKGQEYLKDS